MTRFAAMILLGIMAAGCNAQPASTLGDKTLLWKISGNGLEHPSYLFGTIHMICKDDAVLSDNMKKAIKSVDEVYLEVKLDDMMEMMAAMKAMKMRGDSTLSELLNPADYKKVKDYIEANSSGVPFSMLESYKPMLIESLIIEKSTPCTETAIMEMVIMGEAKKTNKDIKGLETLSFQASIFDSIPYSLQARQLVKMVDSAGNGTNKEFEEMTDAYKAQDLHKLDTLMNSDDEEIPRFHELLLVNRNKNWVTKLKTLLPQKSLLIAVGAGHLPGETGLINLLRKAGFTVTPVENKTSSEHTI